MQGKIENKLNITPKCVFFAEGETKTKILSIVTKQLYERSKKHQFKCK